MPQPQAEPGRRHAARRCATAPSCFATTPRVRIETPSAAGLDQLKGARIDDLVLLREREGIAKDSPPVRLLSPAGAPGAYFAGFGWTGEGVQAPAADTHVDRRARPVLAPGRPVTLSWTSAGGQRFEISIAVDDGYLFTVRAARRQRRRQRGRGAALSASISRADQVARSRQLDRCTSARSACSTARPITTSTRTTLDEAGARPAASTAAAAGSASPTNIG